MSHKEFAEFLKRTIGRIEAMPRCHTEAEVKSTAIAIIEEEAHWRKWLK